MTWNVGHRILIFCLLSYWFRKRPLIISFTAPNQGSRRNHSRKFPQAGTFVALRYFIPGLALLSVPTTMIKNASKANLRQLNLPQQRGGGGVLGLRGWSPQVIANIAPGAQQLAGMAHEILSFQLPTLRSNPGKPTALPHLWQLMLPAQHIGREKKFTQQTDLLKNGNYLPITKAHWWKSLQDQITLPARAISPRRPEDFDWQSIDEKCTLCLNVLH